MATARESANYTAQWTNKYLADARNYDGRLVPLYFTLTVVSTAATGDTYKVTVIPANSRVVFLQCTTDGIGASAGSATTIKVGDSGDDDRYMIALDSDLVNATGLLASTGMGYTPTADTVVVVTLAGTPVVGKIVKGVIFVIPGV